MGSVCVIYGILLDELGAFNLIMQNANYRPWYVEWDEELEWTIEGRQLERKNLFLREAIDEASDKFAEENGGVVLGHCEVGSDFETNEFYYLAAGAEYFITDKGGQIRRGDVAAWDASLKAVCAKYDLPRQQPCYLFMKDVSPYWGAIICYGLLLTDEEVGVLLEAQRNLLDDPQRAILDDDTAFSQEIDALVSEVERVWCYRKDPVQIIRLIEREYPDRCYLAIRETYDYIKSEFGELTMDPTKWDSWNLLLKLKCQELGIKGEDPDFYVLLDEDPYY